MDKTYYDVSLYETVSNMINILDNQYVCGCFHKEEINRMRDFVYQNWQLTGAGVLDIVILILGSDRLRSMFKESDRKYMRSVMERKVFKQLEEKEKISYDEKNPIKK